MRETTYYNLSIAEGNDIVNPLTVDNPNYEKIDKALHDNAVCGVTLAGELSNGNVHALTRENPECSVIRFIATSVWKAGDTMTVDGVPVTALLPSGETLPDGAYVINANVLCILTGTNLTVFAERKKDVSASEVSYGNTNVEKTLEGITSDLSALNRTKVWEDITNSCQWSVPINTTGPYRSRLMYNRETRQLIGTIEIPENTIIHNQDILCTLPADIVSEYIGLCGVGSFISQTSGMNVMVRINGRSIISSHTRDNDIHHAVYQINCFL